MGIEHPETNICICGITPFSILDIEKWQLKLVASVNCLIRRDNKRKDRYMYMLCIIQRPRKSRSLIGVIYDLAVDWIIMFNEIKEMKKKEVRN